MLYSCHTNSQRKPYRQMQYRQTEVLQINALEPEQHIIEQAAALLRAGELVVFPTETVYGLGADGLQTSAVEGIFLAKNRPFSDPLILHIADESALAAITTNVPEEACRLARARPPPQ